MTIRLDKPWLDLCHAEIARVGGQLGVYELADGEGDIIFIGFAGGRSLFGLQGELEAKVGAAVKFRIEITSAYMTRHRELLMVYYFDHGRYPIDNVDVESMRLGKLSPL
jgi:hypothetical protein